MSTPAIRVEDLRVELPDAADEIVDGISFEVAPREILGLVGESGSGKTTVATAMLGHVRGGARIVRGRVLIGGEDLLALPPRELRKRRGPVVAYVPQDPSSALNPALRLRRQLAELLDARSGAEERLREVMTEVHLPADPEFLNRYPHQISGGQQQRFCIAMAVLLRPRLVVFDEPTTGLDVTTQARVLGTVRELCARQDLAAVYVSHDLAVVSDLADHVLVMYGGRAVELGRVEKVFGQSAHPYTASLLGAIPEIGEPRLLEALPGEVANPGSRPCGCVFAPRCELRVERCEASAPELRQLSPAHAAACFRAGEATMTTDLAAPVTARAAREPILELAGIKVRYGANTVLHDVDVTLGDGECLALVGESGSGKTTLSRAAVGLVAPAAGSVRYRGEPLEPLARDRGSDARRELQYVFQNPYGSLNPRKTVGQAIGDRLRHFFSLGRGATRLETAAALERVSLPASAAQLYPDQLSGGERQRVAIARALVCKPRVLICDEITSALDVSVQAAIVNLLGELRERDGLGMIFVTHNLPLVRSIADRVIVMRDGRVVDEGGAATLFSSPGADYTRELIADTPSLVR